MSRQKNKDKRRRVPVRTCIACRQAQPKRSMIRVVASKEPLTKRILEAASEGDGNRGTYAVAETRGSGTFLRLMQKLSSSELEWTDDAAGFTIYKR